MKIVIAPDSFKESLSANEVAEQIAAGFREIFPDAVYAMVPLADGGEGTVQAVVTATGGRIVPRTVSGPLGKPVASFYGLTGDGRTAVIEMAAAAGLMLVPPEERNPLITTTYGVGQLIRAALDAGVSRLVIGIGGSATNDGGAGLLQALGMKLLDEGGTEIGFGGGELHRLSRIDPSGFDSRIHHIPVEVACDVDNPLVGAAGASVVFGPQKGATPAMVAQLDASLAHYARIVRRDLGAEVATVPGAGAAGGLGAALLAIGGMVRPGIDLVLDVVGLGSIAADADLVITGEGRMDGQTLRGKAPLGVAHLAQRLGKPVIAITGSLAADADMLYTHGMDALFSVVPQPCSLSDALADAAENIRRTARNIAATIKISRRFH